MKKILSLVLVLALALSLAACGGSGSSSSSAGTDSSSSEPAGTSDKTLVVGVNATFEEKWNPVMAESAYDLYAIDNIFVNPTRPNAQNVMEPWGGSIEGVENEDGTVTYTVKVNQGMKFTNGDDVTIDDYLYTLYLISDPSYTGPASLLNEDIVGMKEYFYDNENYTAIVEEIEEKVAAYAPTEEEIKPHAEQWAADNDMDVSEFMPGGGYYEEYIVPEMQAEYEQSLMEELVLGDLASGEVKVPEISGVKRVDDYTATVTYNSVSIVAERAISLPLVPHKYYGEFNKGDVSAQMANNEPVGSGPYTWGGFADNIITLKANPDYFEGAPKTGTVKLQYVPEADTMANLLSGAIDIANPAGQEDQLEEMDASSNVTYQLVPNAGYGYMGMNCKSMPQGVRQGIFSLMNRAPAVEGYFGDLATVIERPMTTTLAEYPQDATEYYPYNPEKALEYFESAGYTQKDGQLVNASGEKLVVNAYVGGSGKGDHPAYAMLTQAATALEEMGGELQIQDVDFNVLQGAMNDGTADMWCMAWGAVNNCDKSTQFRTGGGQNRYQISDEKLDAMLDEIVVTLDQTERTALVSEMLDYAMELAIELPLYQRENVWAFNTDNVNMDSLDESTATWDFHHFLWKIEMN